ncbi:hypothetical protein [Chondrinema litorale]|uniref:hypothetical protein n=1 Tax=Chondrinema litorale TaxID=2994555 RepID=UPI002543B511|nr:hypothetical protein [Chondrinema litorale]UZR95323.1 hypothetical protein OQ292_05750 [Chondrinema litorale]
MTSKKKIQIELQVTDPEKSGWLNIGLSGTEEFIKNVLPKNSKADRFFSAVSSVLAIRFKDKEEAEEVEFEEIKK